eukprot:CAMPEP_0114427444 /NCGR_PEP_ID=MMETSP0103-20121206/8354_1 /TAXON_ID=37642 ORGANISM="Paraphysomonas imperforata, Strain PA2" /NCGR_SAMPLE_ID=MMETSP0103 /ASSEMBLY_ACC=CAM_ASM_000201 /LENGTH=113 /DNA_ID=CAMNT_0001596511 /DNA_START=289 /DNA_END=627 /DNA_ORIENTATION=-
MPQNSQLTLAPKGSPAPVDRKMYSPSAKHAPHRESTPTPVGSHSARLPRALRRPGSPSTRRADRRSVKTPCSHCRIQETPTGAPARQRVRLRLRQKVVGKHKAAVVPAVVLLL